MTKRPHMAGELNPSFVHGHTSGGSFSPTYRTWRSMLNRCSDPKSVGWRYYGGKGVTVCERWMLFTSFLADMGLRPKGMTLDRIDGDKGYEPSNCRWATRSQQMVNRNTRCFARGERHHSSKVTVQQVQDIRANKLLCRVTLKELAARYGLSISQVHNITSGKHWRSV